MDILVTSWKNIKTRESRFEEMKKQQIDFREGHTVFLEFL